LFAEKPGWVGEGEIESGYEVRCFVGGGDEIVGGLFAGAAAGEGEVALIRVGDPDFVSLAGEGFVAGPVDGDDS
jgi:hypothetical protein